MGLQDFLLIFGITFDVKQKSNTNYLEYLWATPAVILLPLLTFGTFGDIWDEIGIPATTRKFADLYVVTSAADCLRDNPEWSMVSLDCTPLPSGMLFNYPPIWAELFHALSLHSNLNTLLGYFFSVVFISSVVFLSWSLNSQGVGLKWQLGFVTVAISPTTLFAIERGNIDIIIFVGLVLVFFLLQKRLYMASAIFSSVLGTLKLYPFGIGLMWLALGRKHRKNLMIFLLSSILGVSYLYPYIPLIAGRTGQLDTLSFGSSQLIYVVNRYVEADFDPLFYRIFGTCLFILFSLILYLLLVNTPFFRWLRTNLHTSWRVDIFIASISIYVFTFTLGNNFNYRLIIGILLAFGVGQLRVNSRLLIAYTLLIAIASWISLFGGAFSTVFLFVTWGIACLGLALLMNVGVQELKTSLLSLRR